MKALNRELDNQGAARPVKNSELAVETEITEIDPGDGTVDKRA